MKHFPKITVAALLATVLATLCLADDARALGHGRAGHAACSTAYEEIGCSTAQVEYVYGEAGCSGRMTWAERRAVRRAERQARRASCYSERVVYVVRASGGCAQPAASCWQSTVPPEQAQPEVAPVAPPEHTSYVAPTPVCAACLSGVGWCPR